VKKKIIIVILAIALVVGIFSGCTEENATPDASFTHTADNYYVDTEIEFTDTSTTDDTLTYSWDFGDETGTSTEENPKYTYTEDGTYTVTLTVTDTADQTDTFTTDIVITLKDIVTTAIDEGFSTLATALTNAELVETLQGEGPYTVFAPTNASFDALNQTWLTNLLSDKTNLTKVLKYHVVNGEVMSTDLTNGTVMTLEGTNLTILINTTGVYVNDVMVTTADVECNNGVIHIIGEVLLPESVPGPEE